MHSSVRCLPGGVLTSLALSPDCLVVKASVLYGAGVADTNGDERCWIFWGLLRGQTVDGYPVWFAHAYEDASQDIPLGLTVLQGKHTFTAHQFKGLAVALGIWRSIRQPVMVRLACCFTRQAVSTVEAASLKEYMNSSSHFGLSERAASEEWHWGAVS